MSNVIVNRVIATQYNLRGPGWWATIVIEKSGCVFIQSDYGDYAYRWSSFGDDIRKFLCSCDTHYLYGKFGGQLPREFNTPKTIKAIKKDLIEYRRNSYPSAKHAREIWDQIHSRINLNYTDADEFFHDIMDHTDVMEIYSGDPTSVPIHTDPNFQLDSFLKLIWPEFIKYLQEEIKKE
jgi:hypothetical protein